MSTYLGNYNEVMDLVRDYAHTILDIHDMLVDGEYEPQDAAQSIRQEATEMATIFKGENPKYQSADFLSPAMLAGKIVVWDPGVRGDGDPIREYFERSAKRILHICSEVSTGTSEAQAGPMLQDLIQDMAKRLSGVPQ